MENSNGVQSRAAAHRGYVLGLAVLTLVAVVGLYYVKWNPYYYKAFVAASKHSIGDSIVSGKAASPPPPSLQAAWGYTVSYTLAVWKAMILGLLLGSAVQALVPREWIARLLGRMSFGSVAVAGLASIFSMM
jgi:uncharacterized membrane protein YraQ (UPF0718 family)